MPKPGEAWWRFGIYQGNDNEVDWPRSGYATQAALPALLTALKNVLANPTPHNITVRAVIGNHIGPQWKDEDNAWIRRTFDMIVQEFTAEEFAAIETAFPLE